MKSTPKFAALGTALLTLAAGFAAPAFAATPLTISQEPLYITNRIKPAFIMGVDDSGSMTFEVSFQADEQGYWHSNELVTPTANGWFSAPGVLRTAGFGGFYHVTPNGIRLDAGRHAIPPLDFSGFARSPDFNVQWFDPGVVYPPWALADGSSWPNAPITAARSDPRPDGSAGVHGPNPVVTFDFTADRQDASQNGEFGFFSGMVMPAGTVYRIRTDRHLTGCGGLGGTAATRDTWLTLAANHTIINGAAVCRINIRHFPAVVFRTVGQPAPPGFDLTKRTLVTNGGGNGINFYKYELRSENFLSAVSYNAVIQNFANWYTYYGNRTRATIAGMTRALDNVYFMRAGYFTINNRVNVTMRDLAEGSASRTAFYNQITTLPPGAGTPNRSAADHMRNQFNRTGADAPVLLACQINAGMLFTDGYTNQTGGPAVGNVDGNDGPPFADLATNTIADIARLGYETRLRTDLPAGLVQVSPECTVPTPSPTLNCNRNLHVNFHGVVLGLEGVLYDRENVIDVFANPPVWPTTWGSNSPLFNNMNLRPQNIDDIWHASINSYGTFTSAQNPLDVTRAMQNVLNSVLDATQPTGTPGVAGARVGAGSATYSSTFGVRNNGRDWFGNVESFRINADGSTGVRLWSAESALPAPAARNILAMRTPGPTATRIVVPFQASNFGSTQTDQAASIGVNFTAFTSTFTPGYTMTNAFDYLRGDQSHEQTDSNDLGFRTRSGRIGSIINSPVEVETRTTFYSALDALPGAEGTAYRAYVANKRANFTPTVFVGANAGMLHGFHADTGQELFAYVPNGALSQMGQLLYQNYQHRYYVDGELNATDAVINGNWGTVLLGNMGRGGRSVFALDVTNTASFGAGNVLWELPTTDVNLGQAAGRVEAMYGEDGNWYAVFANGLNSANQDPALFIVNLSTGVVTSKIVVDDGGDFTNGLVRIALADVNGNGRVDAVYGGDYRGNLWKFDLSGTAPTSWNVAFSGTPLFRATDINLDAQPITGAVAVSRGPSGGVMVHFGTGSYLTDTDAVTKGAQQLQSFYGVWDRGSTSGMTRTSLQAQTITDQFGTGIDLGRTLSNNRVNYATLNGWYLDLRVGTATPSGERFIGEPRIIGDTITFPTSEPSGDSECAPGLRSWGYRLDRFSGSPVLNRMERPGGSPVCPPAGCGGLLVQASGAPVTGSAVIQPQRPCRRGIDPECPAVADPEVIAETCGSPNPEDPTYNPDYDTCVDAATAGGDEALVCSISNPIGTQDFGGEPQVCGRQSWRQVR
jgi:type IV pilus assembly protein PilY1